FMAKPRATSTTRQRQAGDRTLTSTEPAVLIERVLADGLVGNPERKPSGSDKEKKRLLEAWVSRKYFVERKLKREIAAELGISRFKVARLLKSAIDDGIINIRIEITDPEGIEGELSSRLQAAYGLRRAVVVTSHPEPASTMRSVARAAAEVVAESLEPA